MQNPRNKSINEKIEKKTQSKFYEPTGTIENPWNPIWKNNEYTDKKIKNNGNLKYFSSFLIPFYPIGLSNPAPFNRPDSVVAYQ